MLLQSLWDIIAIPLGYIMKYCYIFVNDILHLPLAYVFALFLFALITKVLLFPLALKQQKSSAKMAAFQPMMQEIQKTYAKDQKRQQAELQKLQEDTGYSPFSGCLPMLIQFPILFGLVEVIYKPLTFMLTIPKELVAKLTEITTAIMTAAGTATTNTRMIETSIIEFVKTQPDKFADFFSNPAYSGYMDKISNLSMSIGSINLWETPKFALSLILLIPLFSVVTMLLSSLITLKTSGTANAQGGKTGSTMMIVTSLMFAVFSFMYPAGFSLYWGFQNLIIIVQSFILKKLVDPEKIKEQARIELEEKRKSRKKKTVSTVKLKDESTGQLTEKTLSLTELEKLRLQKAREIDDARYNGADDAPEETPAIAEKSESETSPEQVEADITGEAPKAKKGKKSKKNADKPQTDADVKE